MVAIVSALKPGYQQVDNYLAEQQDMGVGCHAGCLRSAFWILGFLMMKTRAHYTDVYAYLKALRPCINDEVLWLESQVHLVQQTMWTWIPEKHVQPLPAAINDCREMEALRDGRKHICRQPTNPYLCSGSFHVVDGSIRCLDPQFVKTPDYVERPLARRDAAARPPARQD